MHTLAVMWHYIVACVISLVVGAFVGYKYGRSVLAKLQASK
jgi:hypothetical protein